MSEKERLEEQIGEVLGLEMAAQKAVEELSTKGLLEKGGLKTKMQELAESEGLDPQSIRQQVKETSQKASQKMQTYLGEDPDTLDAIEFRCLAEGGEVTHYEVQEELAREVKDKKFTSEVASILGEENQHLQLCTQLARENSSN
jgi:hypothetical protein